MGNLILPKEKLDEIKEHIKKIAPEGTSMMVILVDKQVGQPMIQFKTDLKRHVAIAVLRDLADRFENGSYAIVPSSN